MGGINGGLGGFVHSDLTVTAAETLTIAGDEGGCIGETPSSSIALCNIMLPALVRTMDEQTLKVLWRLTSMPELLFWVLPFGGHCDLSV